VRDRTPVLTLELRRDGDRERDGEKDHEKASYGHPTDHGRPTRQPSDGDADGQR
jgi:hypothetical protein